MIRLATKDDIPKLLEMGKRFAEYVGGHVTYSPERVRLLLYGLISGGGVVMVAEKNGALQGLIMGALSPIWYAEENAATELALWIDPDCRGGRIVFGLIGAFELWGKEHQAKYICMSDLCIGGEFPAGAMFSRLGYKVGEHAHIKEV